MSVPRGFGFQRKEFVPVLSLIAVMIVTILFASWFGVTFDKITESVLVAIVTASVLSILFTFLLNGGRKK